MNATLTRVKQAVRKPAEWLEAGRFALGYAAPPKVIVLFLTDRCNLRCKMCAQYGEAGINIGRPLEEMPLELIQSIVDQVACFKPTLIFMGGEPMFHKQWHSALSYAKGRGLTVRVISNGTMLRQHMAHAIDAGLDGLTISVDGPAVSHDKIRGKGTFRVIRESLLQLADLKRRRRVGHPSVAVACTISDVTAPHLLALAQQLADEDWGIDELTIQHLSWVSRDQYTAHNEEMVTLFGIEAINMAGLTTASGQIDVDDLVRQLAALRQGSWPFAVRFYPDYSLEEVQRYYTAGDSYERSQPTCAFIWNATSVYPQGHLTPCMNFTPGNLHEQPFLELWNGPEYRRFRRTLWQRGRLPMCHRCCN